MSSPATITRQHVEADVVKDHVVAESFGDVAELDVGGHERLAASFQRHLGISMIKGACSHGAVIPSEARNPYFRLSAFRLSLFARDASTRNELASRSRSTLSMTKQVAVLREITLFPKRSGYGSINLIRFGRRGFFTRARASTRTVESNDRLCQMYPV